MTRDRRTKAELLERIEFLEREIKRVARQRDRLAAEKRANAAHPPHPSTMIGKAGPRD